MTGVILTVSPGHNPLMQIAVMNLAEMGRLPDESVGDDDFWKPCEAAVRAISSPATDEEAARTLDHSRTTKAPRRTRVAPLVPPATMSVGKRGREL
jgi:hypothetical protein